MLRTAACVDPRNRLANKALPTLLQAVPNTRSRVGNYRIAASSTSSSGNGQEQQSLALQPVPKPGKVFAKVVCNVEMARQLLVGAAMLVVPQQVFGCLHACCANKSMVLLMQLLGAMHMTLGFGTAYVLADALEHGRLGSETYQRLLTGVVLGLLATVAVVRGSAPYLAGLPGLLLPSILVGTTFASVLVAETGMTVGQTVARLCSLALGCVTKLIAITGSVSAFYAAAAAATGGLAVALLGWPYHPALGSGILSTTGGALGGFLKQLLGISLLQAWVALVTLKDASDRGRLGASTFKALNKAAAASCAAQAGVIGYGLLRSPGGLAAAPPAAVLVLAVLLLVSTAAATLATASK